MPPPTDRAQVPAPAAQPQPIHDVVPPANPLVGDAPAADAGSNPIAGTAAAQSTAVIHEQPATDHTLDSVLQSVTSSIKAPAQLPPKKKKFGLFGGSKKRSTPSPIAPAAKPAPQPQNPLQQKPAKPKKPLPIVPISVAFLAAIGLVAAAIFAF